ncbi:rhodanese-like domain-containing protein [Psychroserpens sp. AS72]|uniref:rhodanese-like domain-containing protein n=1 Tax=Psychroserpens sp. AS72 TaxID=3135775 RepID=UPI0031702C01
MKYVIIMSLFTALFGVNTFQSNAIKVLSLTEFKEQTENKNVQLIDVRTSDEFNSGHIKDAINIDFYSGNFNVEFNKLDKEQPVYVYCRSGSRSRQTSNKLEAMGFTEIYDLKGGFLNYN